MSKHQQPKPSKRTYAHKLQVSFTAKEIDKLRILALAENTTMGAILRQLLNDAK